MDGRAYYRCGGGAGVRLVLGAVYLLLFVGSLRAATYRAPLLPGDDGPARPSVAHVLEAFAALPPIASPFELTDLEWHFGLGDPTEGKNPPYAWKPALKETVRTPHRVLQPDTPMWFETTV